MKVHSVTRPRLEPLQPDVGKMKLGCYIELCNSAFSEVIPPPKDHDSTECKPKENEASDVDLLKGKPIEIVVNRRVFPGLIQSRSLAFERE